MGFFRNLWDEALAGPTPDSGVEKFRRYNSVLSRRSNVSGQNAATDDMPVSRSITILRSNSLSSSGPSSPVASSPTGSSAAGSPLSGATSPGGDFKKLTRRKSTADAANRRETKSPTGYDWIVLTSLDR